jgi:mRNA-degrading endonuclease RelE of RelBE toxin-antitoxin system
MRYEVLWDLSVPEGLGFLPAAERKRVVGLLLSLGDEPKPPGVRELTAPPGGLRFTEGRFEVLYVVDHRAHTVTIYQVLKDGQLLNAAEYRIDA